MSVRKRSHELFLKIFPGNEKNITIHRDFIFRKKTINCFLKVSQNFKIVWWHISATLKGYRDISKFSGNIFKFPGNIIAIF